MELLTGTSRVEFKANGLAEISALPLDSDLICFFFKLVLKIFAKFRHVLLASVQNDLL